MIEVPTHILALGIVAIILTQIANIMIVVWLIKGSIFIQN